jgi:hypothetical protein
VRQHRRHQILLELAAQEHNRRRHSRLSLSTDVTLFCLGHGIIKGRISNLSESGFAGSCRCSCHLEKQLQPRFISHSGPKLRKQLSETGMAFAMVSSFWERIYPKRCIGCSSRCDASFGLPLANLKLFFGGELSSSKNRCGAGRVGLRTGTWVIKKPHERDSTGPFGLPY